ncbi:CoA-transferase [Frankia canadensis]|uniref:CoA-transferase n=1 Tax=Frankia canadensis TaxID=1836972 RepID=A0A2I2KS81_9ACTN|nr:CoA transferase [Frankia canadensis]SNQ48524.1 CoA-transferase [Frankia canadensis]SOU55814.1 CoA-transferase [Frankia canadensis]
MSGICAGLTVVEVGSGSVAASIAGMVLADAGARLVKVEPPAGDTLRGRNPSGFLVWNRGKDSVVADLRERDGRERLRRLAASADVVIEALAPGRADGWGVGAGDLRALNARLVHCSITAFGRTGPYARVKGRDELVAAKLGLWSRGAFGFRDGPQMYPVAWPSFGAAMQSVAGVLGALLVRERTGRGQRVDATLFAGLDPLDYFVATVVQLTAKRGEKPSGDARSAISASRYGVLVATKDSRFIQTSTMLGHQARALCEAAGILDIVEADARFAGMPTFATAEIAQEWEDLLLAAFRSRDLEHWMPRLLASPDIAFEVSRTPEQGLDHPQIVHNGDVITIDDPWLGPVREVGPIGHFSATPMDPRRSAPALGEPAAWAPDDNAEAEPAAPATSPMPAGGAVPAGVTAAAGGGVAAGGDGYGGDGDGGAGGPDANPQAPPFAGTTIVEFGYFYAMPYATVMLAELGARVIKIEDGAGDPHRMSFGPEVATAKTTAGKESLSVNLRSEEGRRVAHRLIATADVFVTGFRSGVAERLGLGEKELRALNPRLLYVHAAGYGTEGPYAHRALYAQAAQAVGGSFGRQVGHWTEPSRSLDMSVIELQAIVIPRLGQVVDGDSNAALSLLAALALGIYHQRRTGIGQRLNTSMIAANAFAYSDDFCTYADKPPAPIVDEEAWGTCALGRCYPAAAGSYVCLVVRSEPELRALFAELGLPAPDDDARFATATARAEHDDVLAALLAERFAERPAAEWERALVAAGVGCVEADLRGHAIVTSFDARLRDAGLTTVYAHPLFGDLVRAAPCVTFSETPSRLGVPCVRGENNHALLAELGHTADEIARLEHAGAVVPSTID